ncbi:hypothetical protein J7L27_07410 [Candidatus Bathyarchaeota archaeon]|nr:hypothetical protein [Candidatus Bathyarchaeota archaeon]
MEEIVGVIREAAIRRKYWLPEVCDLYFTDKRVIVASVLSRKAALGYGILIGGLRLGLLGWYLAKRERERYRRIFEGKTPEEILSLEPDNFEIPYEDVSSISLHKHFLRRATIEFKTLRGNTYKFSFPSKQFEDAERIVSRVLRKRETWVEK